MEHGKTFNNDLRHLRIILHHIVDLSFLMNAIEHHVDMANTTPTSSVFCPWQQASPSVQMLHRSQHGRLRYHRCANIVNTSDGRRICEIETGVGGIEIGNAAVGVEGVAGVVELVDAS